MKFNIYAPREWSDKKCEEVQDKLSILQNKLEEVVRNACSEISPDLVPQK